MTLKATTDVQNRFESLVDKAKDTTLTNQEKDELGRYVVLERLAKLPATTNPIPGRKRPPDGLGNLASPLNDSAKQLRIVVQGISSEDVPISFTWVLPMR